MKVEQTENNYKVYLTKEEIAQLDEEDKQLVKPLVVESIELNSLEELKESIEKQYDKKNIAIL